MAGSSFDDLRAYVEQQVRLEEERKLSKGISIGEFRVERTARQLIVPSRLRAEHHRERERHYTKELEAAEKVLREEGVSIEVTDPAMGTSTSFHSVASGAIYNPQQRFQPQINQTMMDAVTRAKTKMLEHRGKAETFEKYARAFACAPNVKLELTIEEVFMFQLEGGPQHA